MLCIVAMFTVYLLKLDVDIDRAGKPKTLNLIREWNCAGPWKRCRCYFVLHGVRKKMKMTEKCWHFSLVAISFNVIRSRRSSSVVFDPGGALYDLLQHYMVPVQKNSNLDKIFKLQKWCCRLMMFSSFRAPSRPLFIFMQLRLLNIYQICKYPLAIYMFKIVHKLVPHLNHQLFSTGSSTHGYDMRFKDALRKQACRTKLRQSTFCFQGPKLWNNLADSIKLSPSLTIFKKNLKISLLSEDHCY